MADSTKCILIVDDTPENISVLSSLLPQTIKAKAAISGERALKICASDSPPDLVFLDVLMPGMDGWEVMARLQENPLTRGIPVVFVTGLESDEDRARAESLGARGFVTKPLDPAIIRGLIASLLAGVA